MAPIIGLDLENFDKIYIGSSGDDSFTPTISEAKDFTFYVVGNEGNHTKVNGVLSALQLHPMIHTKDVIFEKKLYFGKDLIKKEKYNTNKILNQVISNVFKFVKKELEQDIIKIITDIKNV